MVVGGSIVGFFWYQAYTAQGLTFIFEGPDHVQVGVPFDLEVSIENNANGILQEAELTLTLPEDMVFLGAHSGKTIARKPLGNLGEGSLTTDTFQAMVLSGESSLKQLQGMVSYLPVSLGARFEQQEIEELRVSDTGIALDLRSPNKVFSGEEFEIELEYENNSEIVYDDFEVRLAYPAGMTIVSSSLEAIGAAGVFEIGDLQAGSENVITIVARLEGPDNAFFDIDGRASASFLGERYDLNERSASVSISPSPLSLDLEVNGESEYTVFPAERLRYEIVYRNNTNVGLEDVILTAQLSGEMFDFEEISTGGGAFNSGTQTISWNASQIPALKNVGAGAEGRVIFSIESRADYPISRISDRNFTLSVKSEIESPTVPQGVASDRTVGTASIESKVAGSLRLLGSSFFKDASSGILNSGPFPPKVGEATDFTIHWTLQNTSTDMEDVEIKAFLGPNVSFTGEAKSTTGVLPQYNPRTQEVVWQVDRISATEGIVSDPVEAIFQVELLPGSDQANRIVTLVGKTSLKAHDAFTNGGLEYQINEVTTQTVDGSNESINGAVQE